MHSFLKKFIKAENGSLAPMLAGAILPIMFVTGAAVDYTTQARNNSYVLNMADSALLSVTDEVGVLVDTVKDQDSLKTAVIDLLDPILTSSLKNQTDFTYSIDDVVYDEATSELKVDIGVSQETTFIKLAKVPELKATVSTGVTIGGEVVNGALSVAFVIDKSGSMQSDWRVLKAALRNLDTRFTDLDPSKKYIRVGHVLFDRVNSSIPGDSEFSFYGFKWGMYKSVNEISKDAYAPRGGQGTNSSQAIIKAYDKLNSTKEDKKHAKKNSSQLRKVVVFFSDGENDLPEYTTSTSGTCANIKAAGIEIYSIMFGWSVTADAETMMQGCASSNNHYFRVRTGKNLGDAFDAIGDSTTKKLLYLSK